MRFFNYVAAAGLAAMLAACGGGAAVGGGAGGGGSGGGASTASSIEVLTSAASLPSGNDASVTITALVKNAANNGLADEKVVFSADSGVLQNADPATAANGAATARLSVGSNKAQRNITVTVTAGSASNKVVVPVSGTTVSITGASSLLLGGKADYAVLVKDSNGVGVGGVEVALASQLGNSLNAAKATTAPNGAASFSYTANKSGNDVLTASGAGVSSVQNLVINSVNFAFQAGDASPVLTTASRVLKACYKSADVPVAGQKINFSSTRGAVTPTSATTGADGCASTTASSRTAGPATISAQLDGSSTLTTTGLQFVAAVPDSITLQANAAAVPPNAAGTSTNSATVTAIVRDAGGNPVQGATVNFTLLEDTSGGTISPGTGMSDNNGRVSATFTPGATSTAQNGVKIQAATNSGALLATAEMTVSARALFIAIATSNTIANKAGDDSVYAKPFSVQVNDAAGAPVANQVVTLKVWPTHFGKGYMRPGESSWVVAAYQQCDNEDKNKNGFLDAGEDINHNGKLEPGIPGVISPASVTTDSTGFARFEVFYGEQYAIWVDFDITAGATVAGTESRTLFKFPASGMASDFNNVDVTPAAARSPFGVELDCTSAK